MAEAYDLKFLDVTTAIKVEAAAAAVNIDVDSTTGMAGEDAISIVLDDASVHWDIIASVTDADTVVITSGIPAGRTSPVDAVVKTYQAFMLRQEGKTKDWLINDAPLLPQTLITESASPSNINPEREIQISQVDWRKGFQDYKLDDQYKYYESENCDARFKGEVIIAPKKLAALTSGLVTYSATSITNGGLENWDDVNTLTSWTQTGDTITRSEDEHTGTYAGSIIEDGNDVAGTIYQDLSWDSDYQGKYIVASVWGKTENSGALDYVKITLDDGVASTTSASVTKGGAYNQVFVTRQLDASATRLRIQVEFGVAGGPGSPVSHFDLIQLDGYPQQSSIAKMVTFGATQVVAIGTELYSFDNSSLTWVQNFPKTITDLCIFGANLYIAQGWSDEYFYTSDLSSFTESNLSNSTAKYMSNVGGGSQFWITDTNSTMRDSDDPVNGGTAFSSPYQVHSDAYDITGLVNHDSVVFARKEDDVYYLSGANVLSLLDLKSEVSTTYTYGLYLWNNCLYIGSGVNSLYEYDISAGVATVISPVRYAPGDVNYDEDILAICGDETYLYVAQDNGADLKILAGRWETVAGETDWRWHPLYDYTSNDITCMLVSSATGSKRLYVGTDTYTDGIVPFFVPVGYSAVYMESGWENEAAGTFITPWYVSNFPTEKKFFKTVDITSKCITAKTAIVPSYQIKGGSWVAMTACTLSADPGGGAYPDEVTDSRTIELSSERIRFKFAMAAAGDDDYTPILYGTGGGIVVYGVLQTDRKRQIEATILVAPYIKERNGSVIARTIATDLTNLRGLYTGNTKLTVTGPDGTEYSCLFAREGYIEQLAYNDLMRPEVWWITVKLLEV